MASHYSFESTCKVPRLTFQCPCIRTLAFAPIERSGFGWPQVLLAAQQPLQHLISTAATPSAACSAEREGNVWKCWCLEEVRSEL